MPSPVATESDSTETPDNNTMAQKTAAPVNKNTTSQEQQQQQQRQESLQNLLEVEETLQSVLARHRSGRYGSLTREWGFTTPGGLGGRLGGKYTVWETVLERVPHYFWPLEAYESLEHDTSSSGGTSYGTVDPAIIVKLKLTPEGEQLYGNTPLHNFLRQPPAPPVELLPADLDDYQTAARIFLLLGTLSHLCGNSAPDPKTTVLPEWIEDPLRLVAERLQVEPTLSGHFLVQENWQWKSHTTTTLSHGHSNNNREGSPATLSHNTAATTHEKAPPLTGTRRDRAVVQALLQYCDVQDRRFRIKIYPQAFVGSQAIDVLVGIGGDSGVGDPICTSRVEAVRLVRRVNKRYQLFSHVTDEHLLM